MQEERARERRQRQSFFSSLIAYRASTLYNHQYFFSSHFFFRFFFLGVRTIWLERVSSGECHRLASRVRTQTRWISRWFEGEEGGPSRIGEKKFVTSSRDTGERFWREEKNIPHLCSLAAQRERTTHSIYWARAWKLKFDFSHFVHRFSPF